MIRRDSNHLLTPWITIVGLACAFLALFAAPLQAAPTIALEIDTTVDDAALQACTGAAGDCSLRGAIERANADPGNHYAITLPAGTYQLALAPDATPDDNADGDLDVLGTVELQGAGAEVTFVQSGATAGAGIDRLFHVADGSATLTLRDLTLRYGRAESNGGALYNEGTLRLQDVALRENTAVGQDAVGGKGGAVYNLGSLKLLDAVVEDNVSTNEGIGTQQGGNLCGAGIYNEGGSLAITGTLVTGNVSPYSGGGIYSAGGTVTLSATQVLTNFAEGSAGLYIAAGAVEIYSSTVGYNAAGDFGCGGLKNLGDLTLADSEVSHNTAQSSGGGICNQGTLTVTGSALFDNVNRFSGGGIYNEGGRVSIALSSVVSNSVTDAGGGIYSDGGTVSVASTAVLSNAAGGGGGGGIAASSGELYVLASTLANNRATGSAAGGGIRSANNVLEIANSTLSGNAAGGNGGGIHSFAVLGSATLKVSHCTFVGNAAASGGALANESLFGSAAAEVSNSIMTFGTGGDCSNTGTLSGSGNLIDDYAAGACSAISADAVTGLEATLEDNGPSGARPVVQTHMLFPGSNAVDGVPSGACTYAASLGNPLFGDGDAVAVDGRGEGRPVDYDRDGSALCDVGAFERQSEETYTAGVGEGEQVRFGATLVFIERGAGGNDPGEITVTRYNRPPGGGTADLGEMPFYVTLAPSTTTGLNVCLTLCYDEEELNGLDENGLNLYRYVEPNWISVTPDSRDPSGNCVTKAGVTESGAWTLGGSPSAVTVVSATARRTGGAAVGILLLVCVLLWRRLSRVL